MSNKGIPQTLATKQKISLANQKDRIKIVFAVAEYVNRLSKKDFPSITSASIYAGINEKNLINFELSTPDGSDIRLLLDTIRDKQKEALELNGLTRKYDSRVTTLLLNAHHNVKENATQLSQTNIFNGIAPEVLAEALTLSRQSKK